MHTRVYLYLCLFVCLCLRLYVCRCTCLCICAFVCILPCLKTFPFSQLRNPSAGFPRDRHYVCQPPGSSCDAVVVLVADEGAAGSFGSHGSQGAGEGRARGSGKARIERLKSSSALLESAADRHSVAVVVDNVVVVRGDIVVAVAVVVEHDDGSDSIADVVEPDAVGIVAPVDDPRGKEPTEPDPFPRVQPGVTDPRIQAPGMLYHQFHCPLWPRLLRGLVLLCPSV